MAFAREHDHIVGAADARTDQIAREELAIDPGLKEAIVLETEARLEETKVRSREI